MKKLRTRLSLLVALLAFPFWMVALMIDGDWSEIPEIVRGWCKSFRHGSIWV